jgi:RNA polymerase-binding protein DksA
MLEIKHDLQRKRSALASALQHNIEAARGTDHRRELFKDPYGNAAIAHDDEVTATVVDRLARELSAVDRALADVEAGRYGVCQDCGDAIAQARLRVVPFATRCVTCQARTEPARRAA